MSLSSFLLTKAKTQDGKAVDAELDELFKSKSYNAPPRVEAYAQKSEGVSRKKRKLDHEEGVAPGGKKAKKDTKSKGKKQTMEESDSDSDEFAGERESSDNGKEGNKPASCSSSEDEDDSFDPSKIMHESLQKSQNLNKSQKAGSKKRYVPQDETTAQRDLRTVFVGNLSVEIVKKRPLQKQLRRHLLSAVPTAKIESIRFRSVPFQDPTSNLSAAGEGTQKSHDKEGREHDRVRAAAWRHSQDTSERKDEKKFLTPGQKKKIAFIHHEFHSVADTVHAYVVFAHPVPNPLPSASSSSTSLLPKPHEDPYEAAQIAARQCDGTLFMDRLLRADVVGKSSAGESTTDPKLTIFVGNLDFATKEEDLRVFFESMLSNERGGPPPEPEDEENEDDAESGKNSVKKARTWITRVRIVRDRETQLGKGFAYVQCVDRECVDELLALEDGKINFAKRKLRVQRCKTMPGSSVPTKHLTADTHKLGKAKTQSHSKFNLQPQSTSTKRSQPAPPIIVPKGDPKLGEKLANLSKGERKKAKAANADRVARRLAKKKARMGMDVELRDYTSEGKKRVRVRKRVDEKGKAKTGKEKKVRVRSEKSIAKLNTKK